MKGILYVVGTPIGNLSDFSKRAVKTLEEVDFIAAEDTRVTVKLLNHFEIKKPMVSYHEHNLYDSGNRIVERILNGENCAIVTDAGMPAISDPGEILVKQCHENGIKVESVPGPCAFSTALAISGMESRRFTFEGFLPVNKKERKEQLEEIKVSTRTLIFYEAPHKLKQTLADMFSAFGNREIAIVRELTKIHEEVVRTTLENAQTLYDEKDPKGEFVLIVAGAEKSEKNDGYTLQDAVSMAKSLIEEGLSASSAAKQAAAHTGIKRNEIYPLLIEK
ncbi:MAG: 16S rRNA (cytidine(1402)-2'-O)-methyltransferase [Clostridia bacterium]|nr:16S rRNA (cytidine(1402)-2'-O)-methyltransferase [Clostridia bacterium]